MPKESPIQTSFNSGIFSPLLDGHIDAPRRDASYKDSNNLIALKQGPLVRRGGTKNVFEALNPGGNTKVKLLTFLFNDEESYIMQWSGDVIRFYTDDGIVLDSSITSTITDIDDTTPPVVSVADASTFNDTQRYVITGVTGAGSATSLNNLWFKINNTVTGGPETTELFDFDGSTAWIKPRGSDGVELTSNDTTGTGTIGEIFSLNIPFDEDDLFTSEDLFRPDVVQSNDVMYVAQPDFAPRVIARTADDAWTIAKLIFKNGPYQTIDTSDDTLGIVAVSGRDWTITHSGSGIFAATDSTGGSGTATEGNRVMTINFGTSDDPDWRWGKITSFTSSTVVVVTAGETSKNFEAKAAQDEWKLGAYSDTTGYPTVITLHEGRLVFGATSSEPRRVDFSASGGFNPSDTDFTPHDEEGLVRPDDAISVTIGGGTANPIQWIESIAQGLAVGTLAAEGLIRSSTNSESLTPENASYKKSSTVGSASIQPLPIKNALLHVQFARRRLQELIFNFEIDGFQSFDMTELAEHLTRGRIVDMAYQQQPVETIWVVLADGVLLGFTYERNADVLGWHRHVLGGTDIDVKSVAVKPSSDLSRDELWIAAARTVVGKADPTRTYVERMDRFFEDDIAREDIYEQDSGLVFSTTKFTVTGATAADPVVITTSSAHGRSNGDKVFLKGVDGMADSAGNSMVNGQSFEVANVTATTLSLKFIATSTDVDGTAYTAYESGGTLQESRNLFQSLDYLEGETVEVYVDGNAHSDLVVANGFITLDTNRFGANVNIGLPHDWLFRSRKVEAGSATGTSQGKQKRYNQVIARLKDTLGFKYGPTVDEATDEEPFDNATVIDNQTQLFTGDVGLAWPGGFETDGEIVFKGDGPFPVQIQSIMPQVKTSDRVG